MPRPSSTILATAGMSALANFLETRHDQTLWHRRPRRHRLHRPPGGGVPAAALPRRQRPALGHGRAQRRQAGRRARRAGRAGRHAPGGDRQRQQGKPAGADGADPPGT